MINWIWASIITLMISLLFALVVGAITVVVTVLKDSPLVVAFLVTLVTFGLLVRWIKSMLDDREKLEELDG